MVENVSYGRDPKEIGEGDFNVTNIVQNFTTTDSYPYLRSLHDAVAGVGASHTSEHQFARGDCLEGTRREALGDIRHWSSDKSSLPICWLSGTAGVGKSAIALTIAKSFENDGLVASFFFFRSDPRRNNPSALMPTIALGFVEHIPALRAFIGRQISKHPTILDANLEDQFRELVLAPSLESRWAGVGQGPAQKVPNLVILDGLDECGDEEAQLRIFSTIMSSYHQPCSTRTPLKFLICSRPEAWLREAFENNFSRLVQRIVLNNASQTDQDIERLFIHEFEAIRTSQKFARLRFPSPWPSNLELGQLVHKSSSQFVYAATAVKFVKTPYSNPLDQLCTILNYAPGNRPSNSPFPELDQLYHIILSVNPNREKLLSVLAAIFIVPSPLSPSPEVIEFLLCLAPGEVDLTLRGMHSVLNIRGGWDPIQVYHTSFNDYLFDPSRSGIFFIDRPAQTHFLARRWLQALSAEKLRCCSLYKPEFFEPMDHEELYTEWIPFCIRLPHDSPSQELLADLRKVELSAGIGMGYLMTWCLGYKSQKPVTCIPISLAFSKIGSNTFTSNQHGAILKINDYESWNTGFFREILANPPCSFTFKVADCHCGSNADLAPSSRFHRRYEAACLRAVNALVLTVSSHCSDGFLGWGCYYIFKNLIDSSLLQHCVFGAELFAQFQKLFSHIATDPCRDQYMSEVEIKKRRKRLLDWLEMCPERYAVEAENLKSQVGLFFELLVSGHKMPEIEVVEGPEQPILEGLELPD
ncbi:hypothetical protein PM082_015845 [Marasmius tenuissimus]|nr:hypothetical protein PM082_015845 [Marasmius tenuissimus]